MTAGECLREARGKMGLSQRAAAREFGVSASSIKEWESGQHLGRPSPFLCRYALKLGEKSGWLAERGGVWPEEMQGIVSAKRRTAHEVCKERVGKKIGMLTLEKLLEARDGGKYLCRCECGRMVEKTWKVLSDGRTRIPKNCGCETERVRREMDAQKEEKKELREGQLCWSCKHATNPLGLCPWSAHLEPVPGWRAAVTGDGYRIFGCPLFEDDRAKPEDEAEEKELTTAPAQAPGPMAQKRGPQSTKQGRPVAVLAVDAKTGREVERWPTISDCERETHLSRYMILSMVKEKMLYRGYILKLEKEGRS